MTLRTTSVRALLIASALAAGIAMLYAPVRTYPFIGFDDEAYVLRNPHVTTGLTPDNVAWAFTATYESTWQPLTWISYMIDTELHGQAAGGFHVTNVCFHAAAAVLLFLALRLLTNQTWPSALAAALFAAHPLHVEPVTWIASRKDVVSTMFWMLTVTAYARYVRKPGAPGYACTLAALAAGLMAKPMLVTMPLVLLLLDVWPLQRFATAGARRLVLEKVPFIILSLAMCVVAITVQHRGGALSSLEGVPLTLRLANAVLAPARYLGHLAWPRGLAVLYPLPANVPWQQVGLALLFLTTCTTVATAARRRAPWLATGWCWFLVTLVPVLGLVQFGMHSMADRFAYVPAVGIYIAVAWTAAGLAGRVRLAPAAAAALCTALVLILAFRTRQQLHLWRTGEALFRHTLAVTDNNWMIENSLGTELERQGRLGEAETHVVRALQINPRYGRAHYNLGCVLHRQGDIQTAAHHYLASIDLDPAHVPSHFNLAYAFEQLEQPAKAYRAYRTVVELDPSNARAYNNLGSLLKQQGNLEQAADYYRAAVRADPNYHNARFNLGVVLLEQGFQEAALATFETVLKKAPSHQGARAAIGSMTP
jgi:Tfp pilus assembly protein PilF